MSDIPLALSIAHFSPYTLLDDSIHENDPHPLPSLDSENGSTSAPPRAPVPDTFAFSPTHNYTPDPFPAMSLGSTLRLGLRLGNINTGDGGEDRDVRGVRMMCEIQGPAGRYRLGEVVHADKPSEDGDNAEKGKRDEDTGAEKETAAKTVNIAEMAYQDMPRLSPGQTVDLDVQNEMKELGLQVLIVSVAWETEQGRRTFQRFYKFHVNAPLAIKTRIHTSTSPNTSLDPVRRTDVYLEVLMQNTSPEIMAFNKIEMEPVYGLTCVNVTSLDGDSSSKTTSRPKTPKLPLYPNDTRQHLFLLRYTPPQATRGTLSAFPPFFPGGTILPLGRLDVGWIAGKYAEPGRLQTSTLNRRTAVTPIAPTPADVEKPQPTRTTSALAPAPGQSTPVKSPIRLGASVPLQRDEEWEYDLCVVESTLGDGVVQEEEVTLKVRVAMRSLRMCAEGDEKPAPVVLGVQHLEARHAAASTEADRPTGHVTAPSIAFSPPSRSTTPVPATPGSARPFSPGTTGSRPSTPLSAKLRQATAAQLTPRGLTPVPGMARTLSGISQGSASGLLPPATIDVEAVSSVLIPPIPAFPPAPVPVPSNSAAVKSETETGEVYYLGNSLLQTPPLEFTQAQEQYHTSYAESTEPPLRWEAVGEVELRWVALRQGLADLGGIRVLDVTAGKVGREWESVGQVWVKPW